MLLDPNVEARPRLDGSARTLSTLADGDARQRERAEQLDKVEPSAAWIDCSLLSTIINRDARPMPSIVSRPTPVAAR